MELEWHAVSTVSWRSEIVTAAHVESALWLSRVHGLALNVVWYWARSEFTPTPRVPAELGGSDFAYSLGVQPAAFDALARGTIEAEMCVDPTNHHLCYSVPLCCFYSMFEALFSLAPSHALEKPSKMRRAFKCGIAPLETQQRRCGPL